MYIVSIVDEIKKIWYDMHQVRGDIMNIPIGNLTITSFCSQNATHIKFRHDLSQDDAFYEFVSIDIEKDLHEVSNDEKLELENAYIIQDKDKLVGYIYIEGISETEEIVELRYAIHPEFRRLGYLGYSDSNRRGYWEQILEECSRYLFYNNKNNFCEINNCIDY